MRRFAIDAKAANQWPGTVLIVIEKVIIELSSVIALVWNSLNKKLAFNTITFWHKTSLIDAKNQLALDTSAQHMSGGTSAVFIIEQYAANSKSIS